MRRLQTPPALTWPAFSPPWSVPPSCSLCSTLNAPSSVTSTVVASLLWTDTDYALLWSITCSCAAEGSPGSGFSFGSRFSFGSAASGVSFSTDTTLPPPTEASAACPARSASGPVTVCCVSPAWPATDLEQALRLVDLNCRSTVHLAKLVVRDMVARGHGRVLFTSSIASTMPGSFQAVDNASKSVVQSFALTLRNELRDTGVTVTSLMPGPTDTEFFERADMLDTKTGAGDKDDPADVARDGFEALMAGKERVVSHSMATKAGPREPVPARQRQGGAAPQDGRAGALRTERGGGRLSAVAAERRRAAGAAAAPARHSRCAARRSADAGRGGGRGRRRRGRNRRRRR